MSLRSGVYTITFHRMMLFSIDPEARVVRRFISDVRLFPPRSCNAKLFHPGRHGDASSREEAPLPWKKCARVTVIERLLSISLC